MERCRFCKSDKMEEIIDLGNQPMSNSFLNEKNPKQEITYPLVLYRCLDCGLAQVEKCEGFGSIFKDGYVYYSSDSPSNVSHAKEYCDMIMSSIKPKTVMEIGSNDGYLLQHFKKAGCDVFGVDPSKGPVDKAIVRGIETDLAAFDYYYAKNFKEKFDLICGINVLNHQPYINDFVKGLKECLHPEGIVTFEFPYLHKMLGSLQFDTIYHEHLNYYSLNVITKIFKHHGLFVFHAEVLTTQGGSYRIYACHDVVDDSYESAEFKKLTDLENSVSLDKMFEWFSKGILSLRSNLRNFINHERSKGNMIVAYGAAAKANTLINFCGFDHYDISFIVDRSPHKIGKFLPGSHIEVADEHMLKTFRPRFVLITAWNLANEIMKQLAYIREWGGMFVIPIPKLQIL